MKNGYTTLGEVAGRLIKLMGTLGGDNDLMFARGTIEQLQCRGYVQLPGAFDELLGTLEMLAQDARHDREAVRRERDACAKQCEAWSDHARELLTENAKLTELCKAQGKLIEDLRD